MTQNDSKKERAPLVPRGVAFGAAALACLALGIVLYGIKAPGGKESNWVPTSADGKFEVLFRFYGPEKAVFDKTWTLPDIERVAAQ